MDENLNIAEVIQEHPDEWLLFEVLKDNQSPLPVEGRLLFHGKKHSNKKVLIDTVGIHKSGFC